MVKKLECAWVANCHELAIGTVVHKTLGFVCICRKHLTWLEEDPSPTKYIPPIVAAQLARINEVHLPLAH